MDPTTKAKLFEQGGSILSDLARAFINRPPSPRQEPPAQQPLNSLTLRYDPSTNSYNGKKLVRGDILLDAEGKEYSIDRVSGFILMLDRKNDRGVIETISASVDPTDTDRYLSLQTTGRSRFSDPSSSIALPTSEETTTELKRRLAKELYKMELDLVAGLKIAGKPCDCGSNKHTLMLEAQAEELISQDPVNASVYQSIIAWIRENAGRIVPEAIQSGKYDSEYPRMANEFKLFRKGVLGSVAEELPASKPGKLTLEDAKKLASEEAAKEVERAWHVED